MSKHSGSDTNNNTNLFFNAKKKGGYIQDGEFDSPSSNQKYRYNRQKMCHVQKKKNNAEEYRTVIEI